MSIINLPVFCGGTRETRRPDGALRRVLRWITALSFTVHPPTDGYVWAGKRAELDDLVGRLADLGYVTVGAPCFCYVPEARDFAWKVGVRCQR